MCRDPRSGRGAPCEKDSRTAAAALRTMVGSRNAGRPALRPMRCDVQRKSAKDEGRNCVRPNAGTGEPIGIQDAVSLGTRRERTTIV